MANFLTSYRITKKIEGGYSNHPSDTGGETYKGIARNHNKNWQGWQIIDDAKRQTGFPAILDSNHELQKMVLDCYKANYWDRLRLDEVYSQSIANELFDTAVNMGVYKAGTFLQRALNVANRQGRDYPELKVDGKVGSKTLAALQRSNAHSIYKLLNVLQGYEYVKICERNPTQEVFMHGWLRRVFE